MTKELTTRLQPSGFLYEVFFEGGGEVPEELTGKFTSRSYARVAINSYLTKRESKGKTRRGPSKKASGSEQL